MLTLKSFHVFVIALSIVLTAGVGTWGLLNQRVMFGVLSLGIGALLVVYGGYFAWKSQTLHVK